MIPQKEHQDRYDMLLRLGVFFVVVVLTRTAMPLFLPGVLRGDPVSFSALLSLAGGIAANFACARWFESGRLSDFGLGWDLKAPVRLLSGGLLGAGAVGAILIPAIVTGSAAFIYQTNTSPAHVARVSIILLLAVVGEELMFRGYAFQYLTRQWNPAVPIALTGVIFGSAHWANNTGIPPLGVLNTALWGSLLAYACWKSGTLWLPIGLHFGWNASLALSGATLSGFTIGAVGYSLQWSAGDIWSGGSYGPEGGLPTTAMALLVWFAVRRMK